jgi:multidrug resistance efflux pump
MKKILAIFNNPKVIKTLVALIIFFSVLGAVFFYLKTKQRVNIENSVVSSPIIPLSSSMPGKLKTITAIEGQKVKKGDAVAVVGTEIVRSYTDGIVVETNKQIGAFISPSTPIVKMINTNEIRIDGTIDENKGLNQIKVGQVVSFTIDAITGKTFWGYVDEIAQSAKQTGATFSISSERPTQQFEIYARFDTSAYPEIKNGMSAKMTVYTNTP